MLLSLPLSSLPSQVTRHFATLPTNWKRIGADEFQLAMAPGWTILNHEVKKVWPEAPKYDAARVFRLYFQVASGWVGVQVCG